MSRSSKNILQDVRIHNIVVNVTDAAAVMQTLPETVNGIIDFVGHPAKDPAEFVRANDLPAQVMLQIAQAKNVKAMGFIGGILGPKSFVEGKARLAQMLKTVVFPPWWLRDDCLWQWPQRYAGETGTTLQIPRIVYQKLQARHRGCGRAGNGGRAVAENIKTFYASADCNTTRHRVRSGAPHTSYRLILNHIFIPSGIINVSHQL